MGIRQWRQAEIAKRQASALREQPQVKRIRGDAYYGWYQVAGSKGSNYQVEVTLEARRRATCTCRDFATNELDTCKHIEAVRLQLAETPEAKAWRDPLSLAQGDLSNLDVVVFDLETQNLFQDVGGRKNTSRLGLSLGVLYSLRTDSYATYTEPQVEALLDRIYQADLAVGFNVLNFDYPVLEAYGGHRLYKTPTLDMMLLIADELGFRVGLDALAQGTLGKGKSADGLQAVEWYRNGRLDLVEKYCRDDVEVTTGLFVQGRQTGELRFCGRDGIPRRVRAIWQQTTAKVAG